MEPLQALLATILGLLALLVLGLLVLLALLLFAPFRVAGRASRWPDERITGRVLIRWPFWLLGVEMAFDSVGQAFTFWLGPWAVWTRYEERGPEEADEGSWERLFEGLESLVEEVEEEEEGDGWPLTWRETLAQRGVLPVVVQELVRALVRVLTSLQWERLRLRGRVGLGDPASTGMLYGAYAASRPGWSPLMDVHLVPEFAEAALWGEAEGAVRIWVWRLLWPLLWSLVRLAFSRPIWRLAGALTRGWWRARRRRKREERRQRPQKWQREPSATG